MPMTVWMEFQLLSIQTPEIRRSAAMLVAVNIRDNVAILWMDIGFFLSREYIMASKPL